MSRSVFCPKSYSQKYAIICVVLIIIVWHYFGRGSSLQGSSSVLLSKNIEERNGWLLNFNRFKYVINPGECNTTSLFAVILVHSHPGNKDVRSLIRKHIPDEDLRGLNLKRFFLFGLVDRDRQKTYNAATQEEIQQESDTHHDIVQGNFDEHYHNLTYKHVMGLKWSLHHCPVKYIIKMDDDIVIDVYQIRDMLRYRYFTRRSLILGLLSASSRPIRKETSKWFVSRAEYPRDVYPDFVSGWIYAMTFDAARRILALSTSFPYFWIDDVHVTGTLAQAAGVKREGLNR